MKSVLVAVVGLAGTGKSQTTAFITEKYSFKLVYFGGYVLEEVKRRNLEVNSRNERSVREELRQTSGMDVIAKLSYRDIEGALSAGSNVVIDGLYSYSEYSFLKERIPDRFYLVAVHAAKKLRYERLSNRTHRPLSAEEVDSRDHFEIKNLEKCGPIVLADYHIVNDSSVESLHNSVETIIDSIILRQ